MAGHPDYNEEVVGIWLFDSNLEDVIASNDFAEDTTPFEELVIYCLGGFGRSPSIGAALNEIFNLGNDTAAMRAEHRHSNPYIYETMIETARRKGMLE